MAVFQQQIKTAHNLINKFGQTVKLISITNETDVNKPFSNVSQKREESLVNMVFMPIDRDNLKTLSYFINAEIPKNCVQAYMTSQTLKPNLQSLVERNGEVYKVLTVDEINPNGESCLFKLVLVR